MQENRIEFLPSAWQDLGEIAERRWRNAPCSAEQITGNILCAVDGLSHFPNMGSPHPDPVLAKAGFRKLACRKYVVVYQAVGLTVYLYRIVHGITEYPKLLY